MARWVAVAFLCALATAPPSASAATPGDIAATISLREAELVHAEALVRDADASERAGIAYLDSLAAGCPRVLEGAPARDVEGPPGIPSPRRRGELARAEHQLSAVEQEATTGLFDATQSPYAGADAAFKAAVSKLSWSDPRIASALSFELSLPALGPAVAPAGVCADLRSWAASGFKALAAGTKAFEAAQEKLFVEPPGAVSPEKLLEPTESPAARRIEARIMKVYRGAVSKPHASTDSFTKLRRILGEPPQPFELSEHSPVIARGRARDGERIVIRGGGEGPREAGCKHRVAVEFNRGGRGLLGRSSNIENLCMPARQMLASGFSCNEGQEQIVVAMGRRVRSVRLTLIDGSTIDARTFRVPRAAGGPAEIYAESLRGYEPHPVSLTELDASGATIKVLKVPAVARCKRRPPPVGPKFIPLATGTTPSGVGYTIEGAYVRFGRHKSFSVSVSTTALGIGRDFTGFGPGPHERAPAFPLQLSAGCPPQPYWIVYGLLAPPGASVQVRTAAGVTQLTSVAIPVSYGAEGPLEYGLFDSPPLEVSVKRSDGTTLSTEAPVKLVVEEGQFCEGYAEP